MNKTLKYYTAKCPHCGNIQVNQTKSMWHATFKCRKCNKSKRLLGKHGLIVKILYQGNDDRYATNACKYYKQIKNQGGLFDEKI